MARKARKPSGKKAQGDSNQRSTTPPSPQTNKKKRPATDQSDEPKKKRKRKTKPTELTPKQIITAYQNNPPECYVVGPTNNKWVDNGKAMAAYLGFLTAESFRHWLTMDRKEANRQFPPSVILATFQEQYENNYGKPSKVSGSNRTNVSRTSIWDQLATNSKELMPQMVTGASLPPLNEDHFRPGTKLYPIMIHITAMAFLIRTNPEVFVESAMLREGGGTGYGGTPFTSEDLYRAFLLLKFHLRHKSGAKATNSFYDSKEAGDVQETQYFTPEELEAAQTAIGPGADAQGQDEVHPMEELARAEDEGPELKEDDARTFTQEEEDFEKGVAMLETIEKDAQFEVDPERAGIKQGRPPINRATQRTLCERLAKKVRVLHEEKWMELEAGEDAETMLHRAIDRTEAIDEEVGDGNREQDKDFWMLMNKISNVSAPTISYKKACARLLLDPNEPKLRAAGGEGVTLNPWQVTGLQWALSQEEGPIRGGVIADACGIGKTIQMLSVIASSLIIQKARAEKQKTPGYYRPTLVLCPSAVIEVWFTEIRKHFPSLRAFRWYETADKQRLAHIRDATLPHKVDDLKTWLKDKCPTDNAASGAIVIISSYETCCTRGLTVTPSAKPQTEALWVGEHDEPAGALVDTRNEYSTSLAGLFQRVVLDEGTKIKNPQTLASNMVVLLNAQYKWVLTATPMMNRAFDYIGYLHLLWNSDMELSAADEPEETKALYTDDTFVPQHTKAYLPGGKYDFKKYGLPLWRLNPYMFKHVMTVRQVDLSALTAFEVVRAITQLVTLRRTQATEMEVNGELVRIGSSIPRYQICTVEVDFENDHVFHEYEKRFSKLTKNMGTKTPSAKSTPLKFMAPRAESDNAAGRNFGIHRRLCLMTFNTGLDQVVKRISNNFAADVDRWYHMHRDGGMSLYFRATRPVRNMPSYPDRYSFAMYLAKDSPKLQYMAGLVGKICRGDDPQRVLIYADYPMPHWNIEGFLKNIGFNTCSLRSAMDASERAAAIDRFNDPNSDVDVLTTSFGTSSFGLNLQSCCSNLIIMAVAQNVNLVLQIIGRIHRLGQSRIQRVWIITLARSYDNFLQHEQTKKMVAQLAGEADVEVIEPETDGEESDLDDEAGKKKGKQIRDQCKEMIRRLLGQRVSRADEAWGDRHDLEGPWVSYVPVGPPKPAEDTGNRTGEQAPDDENGEQAPDDENGEQAPADETGEQSPDNGRKKKVSDKGKKKKVGEKGKKKKASNKGKKKQPSRNDRPEDEDSPLSDVDQDPPTPPGFAQDEDVAPQSRLRSRGPVNYAGLG